MMSIIFLSTKIIPEVYLIEFTRQSSRVVSVLNDQND